MKTIPILLAVLPVLMQASIIDNCIRYFSTTEPKSSCLECRDGFFVRMGTCMECNKIIKNAECGAFKAFTYGSNLGMAGPIVAAEQKNSNATSSENKTNGTANVSDPVKPVLVFPSLQNCKEIVEGKCIKCFTGYQIGSNFNCVKKEPKAIESKMESCFVFSEIEFKCVMCDDGFETNPEGNCKPVIVPQVKKPQETGKVQGIALAAEPIYVRAEVVSTLQKSSIVEPSKYFRRGETLALASDSLISLQLQGNTTSNSSNATIDLSKKPLKIPQSPAENVTVPRSSKEPQELKRLIKIQQDKSLENGFVIKLNEEDNCAQYDKNNSKNCVKCLENYLLNPLINKCLVIAKPIDLSKAIAPAVKTIGKVSGNKTEAVANNTVQGNPVPLAANSNTTQPDPGSTTITIIVSNGNANSAIINISTSVPKPAQVEANIGNKLIITQTPPAIPASSNSTSPTNNASTSNGTVNVSNVSVSETPALAPAPVLTPALAPASPSVNATQNSTSPAPAQTSVKATRCQKLKEGTAECIQCQPTYQLYQGKCYDAFSYRLLMLKSKTSGQTV